LVWQLLFGAWALLFLAQGPKYPTLLVSAILVVVAIRQRRLAVALILVALAAYFAHLSRWTWTYAPGLWAGMLALAEIPAPSLRPKDWPRLLRPVALGLSGYVGGQFLPLLFPWQTSAIATQSQGLSLIIDPSRGLTRQPLLWDRLFPNPTYPPGILLGVAWVALPVLLLVAYLIHRRIVRLNALQLAGFGLPALVFLIVGVIASTKIGGGSNLHNLDMFWITLALLAAWALPGLTAALGRSPRSAMLQALLAATVLLPAFYVLQYGSPLTLPAPDLSGEALEAIRTQVAEADAAGGQVLFMDQRQLLTFGDVPKVPLVGDYEKKYLMDQAMAANEVYFEQFHRDLAAHRFELIVSEPLWIQYKPEDNVFSDENDAFVRWVSTPVLCYYEPLETFREVGVQLLTPRAQPLDDPLVKCPLP